MSAIATLVFDRVVPLLARLVYELKVSHCQLAIVPISLARRLEAGAGFGQ
jgi:hypothetical protein